MFLGVQWDVSRFSPKVLHTHPPPVLIKCLEFCYCLETNVQGQTRITKDCPWESGERVTHVIEKVINVTIKNNVENQIIFSGAKFPALN